MGNSRTPRGPFGCDIVTRYTPARYQCVPILRQSRVPCLTIADDVPQWMGDWLPQIVFGATGLIGTILWSALTHSGTKDPSSLLSRTVYQLVKRPWRLYIDRAEFAFSSLLCILWTCKWCISPLELALTASTSHAHELLGLCHCHHPVQGRRAAICRSQASVLR